MCWPPIKLIKFNAVHFTDDTKAPSKVGIQSHGELANAVGHQVRSGLASLRRYILMSKSAFTYTWSFQLLLWSYHQ